MVQIFEYYGRYNGVRRGVAGLPRWGKLVLFIFALPGLVGVGLSILALGVSILALLLLTAPVYRLLAAVFPGRDATESGLAASEPMESPGRRHVDVTIVE